MGNDWTFEATDIVSGRTQIIDPGWPRSAPATDPLNGFPGNYCDDERLYETRDGVYVLVWRADQYRHYFECQRMDESEARDWCKRQGMAWPEGFSNATPMTAAQPPATEHRTLWELGLRIAPALDALYSAIGELFDDDYECTFLGIGGDGERKVRAAAVELHARMPPENDPFREWELFGAPRGTQDFVNIVSSIDAFTKRLVNDLAYRDTDGCYWSEALKKTHGCRDFLRKNMVKLESLPELRPYVLAKALRKLQEPAPAAAAADGAAIGVQVASPSVVQSIERRIEPDGTVSGTPTALRTFDALDAGAVKATSASAVDGNSKPEQNGKASDTPAGEQAEPPATEAAVEALSGDAVAVESAPESNGNDTLPDKRLWTVAAAQPIVYAYLQKHPYATAKAIETETGIPDSTVCKTQAWKRRRFKRPKGKRKGQANRGAVSLTEKVMAMAEKVAGPDVDIEGLIRRCEAEPDFRQTLEDAYEASMADGAAQEQGRRPVA